MQAGPIGRSAFPGAGRRTLKCTLHGGAYDGEWARKPCQAQRGLKPLSYTKREVAMLGLERIYEGVLNAS